MNKIFKILKWNKKQYFLYDNAVKNVVKEQQVISLFEMGFRVDFNNFFKSIRFQNVQIFCTLKQFATTYLKIGMNILKILKGVCFIWTIHSQIIIE